MRVKICGITRPEDARLSEEAGADAIGLIFAAQSRRCVGLEQARALVQAVGPLVQVVGVFVDQPLGDVRKLVRSLRLGAVQLHGREDAAYAEALRAEVRVIKAFSFGPQLSRQVLAAFPADAVLLDGLRPGSGEAFDWGEAAWLADFPHLILAGGLTPENVVAGVRQFRPYAVDVSTGVEAAPGIKDAEKLRRFVRLAKEAPGA